MQITDYFPSANFPFHTLHFHPGSLCDVFTCCAPNVNEQNTYQDIFSISQQLGTRLRWVIRFMLSRVPLSVSFIQKRVTGFHEILYPNEWAKKCPEISACWDMGESHICLDSVLPEQSYIGGLLCFNTALEKAVWNTKINLTETFHTGRCYLDKWWLQFKKYQHSWRAQY